MKARRGTILTACCNTVILDKETCGRRWPLKCDTALGCLHETTVTLSIVHDSRILELVNHDRSTQNTDARKRSKAHTQTGTRSILTI